MGQHWDTVNYNTALLPSVTALSKKGEVICFSPHVIYVLNTQTRERIYFLELVHKGVPSSFADQIFAEKWFADWAVTPLQTVCKVDNGKGVKKDWKWTKKG